MHIHKSKAMFFLLFLTEKYFLYFLLLLLHHVPAAHCRKHSIKSVNWVQIVTVITKCFGCYKERQNGWEIKKHIPSHNHSWKCSFSFVNDIPSTYKNKTVLVKATICVYEHFICRLKGLVSIRSNKKPRNDIFCDTQVLIEPIIMTWQLPLLFVLFINWECEKTLQL